MATRHLGETLDIHTSSRNLIFPHHENEIAIAEALTGKSLAKYWLHSELVLVDGKMILSGETVDTEKPGGKVDNRISWQPLPDGRVRQLWETSADKGRTWATSFDGYYTRQK